MADRVEVTCPCCSTVLTVDGETGDVLAEDRPKQDTTASFERALGDVRSGGARRDEAFSKAFDKTQRSEDVLSKKFEEAKKRAAKDSSKPFNPFDMD